MATNPIPRSGIYCIRNLRSGRVYVGSSQTIRRRWQQHRRELAAGTHHAIKLQRSWAKHGADAFGFFVLEAVDVDRLIEREQHWIDALHAADKRLGFNTSPTAGNCLGVRHTDETKAKLSAARAGVPKSAEHRKAIGDAQKGKVISAEQRITAADNTRRFFAENPSARERMREVGRKNGSIGHPMPEETKARLSAFRKTEAMVAISKGNLAKVTRDQAEAGWAKSAAKRLGQPNHGNRKFTFEQAEEMRAAQAAGETFAAIGQRHGIAAAHVFNIIKRTHQRR